MNKSEPTAETTPLAEAALAPGVVPTAAAAGDETAAADADTATGAGEGTARAPSAGRMSMAEYEEAMTPRAQAARARGLSAPYIAGGRDPDPEKGLREERYYMRLLIAMVAAIVLGGFAISILYLILTGGK